MKTKRLLSILIIISMIMSFCGVFTAAEEGDIVQNEQITIIHNIADKYTDETILSDENIYWFLADLADYATAYPESEFAIGEELKQSCLDKVIEFANTATTPGDLSKAIIALRSLGYDAKKVTTKEEQEIDVLEKLTPLVDEQSAAVSNIYTLPYVIIALQQGENYATSEQMDWLIEQAISQKASWQDTMWGPDGAAPMVLALRPYYETNEDIKALLDETVEIIKNCQTDTGMMSDSVCSTGVSMVSLASMGIECEEVIKNENNLIDGLMTYKTQELDGFNQWGYSFDTEQGFRGLIAWQLAKQGKRIYDFSQYPMNEARATVDLPAPAPTPSPEPEEPSDEPSDAVSIKIKVMIHSGDECNNSYTYKNNSSEYTALVNETVIADRGASVFEVLDEVLTRNHIDYTEGSAGYIVSIDGIGEFDHGDRSGWMFTVDGKHVNVGSNSKLLTNDATVVWFYTDDYSREKGSENYSTSLGGTTVAPKTDVGKKEEEEKKVFERNPDVLVPEIQYEEKTFGDIENHQNQSMIEELAIRGIINGMTDSEFCPDNTMTRAEFSTIVVRALGLSNEENTEFDDVSEDAWYYNFVNIAFNYGIVEGMSENEFNPNGTITREQAATMIQRAAVLCGLKSEFDEKETRDILAEFVDYVTVSDWAKPAMAFCYSEGILDKSVIEINPKTEITRAEVAQMVYNVLKEAELI